jgi:serine O-acetyltransferase
LTLRELLDADWARLHAFADQSAPKRHFRSNFSPRFAPVFLLRVANRLHERGWSRLAKLFALINFLAFGLEVSPRLSIGPGLIIPHSSGTIIGAGYVGSNVTIYQQVTLGAKMADFAYRLDLRPHVADNVVITAGAKILGPIRIGEGAVVGANSVVLQDVPAGALAVGVPARIIPKSVRS